MEAHTFALISLFGVPVVLIALVLLGHKVTPKRVWFSFPVQTVATAAVLGAIGVPIYIFNVDGEGEYFDDETELVGRAFALPAGARVSRQMDRTIRLGDCWRNAVNWRSEVAFPSAEAFDRWYESAGYKQGIVRQIADYFGQDAAQISIVDGALDMRERDPQYQLSQEHGSYDRNVRILEFDEPFVCTAIEKDGEGRISLRPCDPIAIPADSGDGGWVIVNPSVKDRTLEGRIYYAQGPHTCTNPLRRALNTALGLPHPEGGDPNTSIGGMLPSL